MNIFDDSMDFSVYLRATEARTNVRPASQWVGEIKAKLRNHGLEKKIYLPWDKTREVFNFRPGEVTLWAGQNGHGKSLLTSQIALSLLGQEQKCCIASFEMKPATTVQRMARMFCEMNPFSPEFQQGEGLDAIDALYDDFGMWTDSGLWLYDQQGTADADTVIGMARYCAKELGITHIFIDSLMKCVAGEDDYNGQKSFVDELTAVARDHACHIHLIHHLRKPANESQIPDKHDNKGSGAITDMVDNIFMIWRNKPKEDDIKANGPNAKKAVEADTMLLCRKQRNGEEEPTIKLWFDKDAMQYVGEKGDCPMYFPNYPHRRSM